MRVNLSEEKIKKINAHIRNKVCQTQTKKKIRIYEK